MSASEQVIAFFRNKRFLAFIIAFTGAFIAFPTFFEFQLFPVPNTGPSWLTLDPSWQITFAKVNIDHLNWGKDFVITYGPLSYLSTRTGWGADRFCLLASDLFVCFNFFWIFYYSYRNSANTSLTLLLIVFSVIMLPVYSSSGLSIILLAFLVFWIRQSMTTDRHFFYCMQVLIIVLLFFIKFNTGLISFVFFAAGIVYALILRKKQALIYTAYLLLPVLLIAWLSGQLNVSILPYLKGGLNMVSGHNEIMYLEENYTSELHFAWVLLLLGAGMLLSNLYFERTVLLKHLLIVFLFSCSGYILYKQGFVRADSPHISEFYRYILLFVICIPEFHVVAEQRFFRGGVIAIVFITFFFGKRREQHLFNLEERLSKSAYTQGFTNFSDSSGFHLFPNNNQIPSAIKAAIGNSRIDAYPWNTQMLLENRLHYVPRPVFQSYLSYTPYLENLNFDFYNSEKAPEYVLYELDAIDQRYPLFDEPRLNLLLMRNYTCADTFSFAGRPVMVLKKNSTKKIGFEKTRSYDMHISWALVPQPDTYYELEVKNSLRGKLFSLARYSPPLTLMIRTKDGNQRYYRTSKKLLESGLFSTRFLGNTLALYHVMKNDSFPASDEITAYGLIPADSTLFDTKIRVTEYRIR